MGELGERLSIAELRGWIAADRIAADKSKGAAGATDLDQARAVMKPTRTRSAKT